jgi:hypothetical protein
MMYAVEMGSGVINIRSFIKIWFRHSKVNRGDTQTHKECRDHISLLLFFQNKESRLIKSK